MIPPRYALSSNESGCSLVVTIQYRQPVMHSDEAKAVEPKSLCRSNAGTPTQCIVMVRRCNLPAGFVKRTGLQLHLLVFGLLAYDVTKEK